MLEVGNACYIDNNYNILYLIEKIIGDVVLLKDIKQDVIIGVNKSEISRIIEL